MSVSINKSVDVVLNVRPVYVALIHQYAYEGPCRFGPPEALTKEFDEMHQPEIFKAWSTGCRLGLGAAPGVNIMEPIYVEMTDEFFCNEENLEKLTIDMEKTDLYIFNGMRCECIAKDFAMKYKKPISCMGVFGATILNSALSARGYEVYAFLDIPDGVRLLNALRARKAMRNTRVLAVTRNNSHYSMGAQDAFLSNEEATKRLGTQFTYFSVHEFLDMLHVNENSDNHTLPGRTVYNLTDQDMVEVNKEVDELMDGTNDITMKREYIVNSVKSTYLAKKLMKHFGCNAFTAPCPDACATRRLNQEQFTYCLTHSLLNEQGIASACEYDLIGLMAINALANLTGKAPYMGNTQPCLYHNGKLQDEFIGISYIPEMNETPNIYHTAHATPNRKMHGFNAPSSTYAIRPFTHSGWGATIRIDFNQFKGEEVTCMRFNPDCNKIIVATGKCVGGFGYDLTGCTEGMYFEVNDKYGYFHKQSEFGLHMPIVFGNHLEDVKTLGKVLGMEVVIA